VKLNENPVIRPKKRSNMNVLIQYTTIPIEAAERKNVVKAFFIPLHLYLVYLGAIV
jgi:hypothetical protein